MIAHTGDLITNFNIFWFLICKMYLVLPKGAEPTECPQYNTKYWYLLFLDLNTYWQLTKTGACVCVNLLLIFRIWGETGTNLVWLVQNMCSSSPPLWKCSHQLRCSYILCLLQCWSPVPKADEFYQKTLPKSEAFMSESIWPILTWLPDEVGGEKITSPSSSSGPRTEQAAPQLPNTYHSTINGEGTWKGHITL